MEMPRYMGQLSDVTILGICITISVALMMITARIGY